MGSTLPLMNARLLKLAAVALFVAGCQKPPPDDDHGAKSSMPSATARGARGEQTAYRARLGPDSPKIQREGDQVRVLAGQTADGGTEWYDFTGAPFPPEHLQFGIGRDRIPSIDNPVFVKPDDERLLDPRFRVSGYRTGEAESIDDIPVMGYVHNGEAKAYPINMLDAHELVNDRVGGKPVTVGW